MSTYLDEYRSKLVSDFEAASLVKSGDTIVYGSFLARPVDFDRASPAAGKNCVMSTSTAGDDPDRKRVDPCQEHFVGNVWFYGAADRALADEGLVYLTPQPWGDTEVTLTPSLTSIFTCSR